MQISLRHFLLAVLALFAFQQSLTASEGSDSLQTPPAYVLFSGDTLFSVYSRLGPFSANERANAIGQRLGVIVRENLNADSLRVVEEQGYSRIFLGTMDIMAVTDEDAIAGRTTRAALTKEYVDLLRNSIGTNEHAYSLRSILERSGVAVAVFLAAFLIFWTMRKVFPMGYAQLEHWEGTVFRPLRIRSRTIAEPGSISAFFIVLLKGVRLVLTLAVVYIILTYLLSLIPFTRGWNINPILIGILLTILATTVAFVVFKALNTTFRMLIRNVDRWKGSIIRPVKLKTVEVLSEERLARTLEGFIKILRTFAMIGLIYLYVTIVFSFFSFTQTWAGTLVAYIVRPLWSVLLSCIQFLPNLFFILVILFVTTYVIKFIKLVFREVGNGAITFPGFYREWADPTFKIVRFLIFAFAAIVIFPYLPGSSSPVFQGISVFLGILFSLGSTGAVANIVAGVVLTYMRPFKIGDRVKIADTVGDVIEKTLLVTRVRTIKNVDVTIPNSMVLGSHIINYNSAAENLGLILHTTVSIGYSVPWKKVHDLLIKAALGTENILKQPKPFVLQIGLNDFYVSYELNAYTDKPNMMATLYSDLHQHIQDTFNEAGIEIMSPHYSAVRDGNQTAIPETYLPKSYQAPAFKIFSAGEWFRKPNTEEGER